MIVRENQTAVFFHDGKALDGFDAGRHTITTANLPILTNLLHLVTGGKDIFTAEVYFVNRRDFLDMKSGHLRNRLPYVILIWDWPARLAPIPWLLPIRSCSSPRISAPWAIYNQPIQNYLRGIVVSKMTDVLGESKKGLFDLPRCWMEASTAVRVKVTDDFALLGIAIKRLSKRSAPPKKRRLPLTSAQRWAPWEPVSLSNIKPAWRLAA